MSFICVICRDLLKTNEEEASPRHQQQLPLPNANVQNTTNYVSITPTHNASCSKKGKSNSIVATKCGHLFHYPCLSVWLSQSMNLTSDSKMRCPSCKQLIYIYELIQLFPVENGNGCSKDLEQLFSAAFQQKLKAMLEHLERLCRDLSKKNNEISSSSPIKGNETPTRLQRVRDSPKKSHTSQLAHLMKEMDSLRSSIKELNSLIEQHAELGSIVDKQTKEISELRSKNEQLILVNERLKSVENKEEILDKADLTAHRLTDLMMQNDEQNDDKPATHVDEIFTRTAQDIKKNHEEMEKPLCTTESNPSSNNSRRKSVTFLDPFDEEFEDELVKTPAIPFEKTENLIANKVFSDFRVGDKVVWNFEGNQEVGTVKWKGFIGSQINVGVEFERQLGIPIKDLSSDALQCIFKFKPGHGRIIPVQEVVLYNKDICKKIPASDSSCNGVQFENGKTSTSGLNKRIQLCSHQ